MKIFFTVTAFFEALTGVAIIIVPSMVTTLLLGNKPEGAVFLTLTKITGIAILTLAFICWHSRNNISSHPIIKAMLFYNAAVVMVLLFGFFGSGLTAPALWPAIIVHLVLAIWCIQLLQKK